MDQIICPRCLGKKHVDQTDIQRLNRQNEWIPGPCAYCEETGLVNVNKPDEIPVDKIDLTKEGGLEEIISRIYHRIIEMIIDEKNDSEILAELEKEDIPIELSKIMLEKAKSEIKKVKGEAHREVGGEYLLKGSGYLALGAIITGVTYSIASNGGMYVVTTGLFAVGGIYVIIGIYKYLSNL